jgi:excisionase family DNA binding protein
VNSTRLLSVRQAADRLGLSIATIRSWVYLRRIEYVKIGRSVRLREDTLQALIEDGTIPALKTHR